MKLPHLPALAAAALVLSSSTSEAVIYGYYVGTDNMTTFASGTYSGMANPNYNRLTFLLAHSYPVAPPPGELDATINHFHTLGRYAFTGSAASPSIIYANARVPEGVRPAMPLQPGTGAFSGMMVSSLLSDPVIGDYTNLTIAPTGQLRAYHENAIPNEPEDYMYFGQVHPTNPALSTAASNQRYSTTSLAGSDVYMELVSMTAGLSAGDGSGTSLWTNPGDQLRLGDGNTFSLLEPKFWTAGSAAPGLYQAKFKLVDKNNLFGNSGEFFFEFEVVPEPSSALLGVLSGALLLRRRRA